MSNLIKFVIVCAAVYLLAAGYFISKSIHTIRVNSFKIGCMSADATYEAKVACMELAEEAASK